MAQLPVYYINLAARTDRRAFMAEQFARLDIEAERIEATTISEIPPKLAALHAHPDTLWPLGGGDIACGLSHHRAWQRLLDSDAPAALVLEDDTVLAPELGDFLDPAVFARLDADLVKLETYRRPAMLGPVRATVAGTELRELCSSHMGAAAYLISRDAAARTLASPQLNTMAVDRLLFGRGGPHLLRSRVLQASPGPCVQLDRLDDGNRTGASDIARSRLPRQRALRTLPVALANLRVHLDHAGRLIRMALRHPAAMTTPRSLVPFAGDPA